MYSINIIINSLTRILVLISISNVIIITTINIIIAINLSIWLTNFKSANYFRTIPNTALKLGESHCY